MKKLILLLLSLALLLWGCASREVQTKHTVIAYDLTMAVDTQAKTITHGEDIYTYEISGNTTRITYPDGSWYLEMDNGTGGSISWSDDYSDDGFYLRGMILLSALDQLPKPEPVKVGKLLAALVLMGGGLFLVLKPEVAFGLRYGRWIKDAEPTEYAIGWTRFSGVAAIVIGIILLLVKM